MNFLAFTNLHALSTGRFTNKLLYPHEPLFVDDSFRSPGKIYAQSGHCLLYTSCFGAAISALATCKRSFMVRGGSGDLAGASAALAAFCSKTAVSYTHLDVYKRQLHVHDLALAVPETVADDVPSPLQLLQGRADAVRPLGLPKDVFP